MNCKEKEFNPKQIIMIGNEVWNTTCNIRGTGYIIFRFSEMTITQQGVEFEVEGEEEDSREHRIKGKKIHSFNLKRQVFC
jgi:hypothetical protein